MPTQSYTVHLALMVWTNCKMLTMWLPQSTKI